MRDTRSRIDRAALVAQVGSLQQELGRLADASTRNEGETAIVERRKALALLEEIERAEARCALHLSSLEATLDTAYLTLRHIQPADPAMPSVESVRRDLDAEIAAIAEQELAGSEELRAGQTR